MELGKLIAGAHIEAEVIGEPAGVWITGITNDSRQAKPGVLFAAVKGTRFDGCHFARAALQSGATAILTEAALPDTPVVQLVVRNVRQALGRLSSCFYGHPSQQMRMFGVTGTNGKTTVTHLLERILLANNIKTGLIGTIYTRCHAFREVSQHTTPDSPALQQVFSRMRHHGVSSCVLEVSSHALALSRVTGTEFDGACITNITRDHLDFHGSWNDYLQTKLSISQQLRAKRGSFLTINLDDPALSSLKYSSFGVPVISYGQYAQADVKPLDVKWSKTGSVARLLTPAGLVDLAVNLPGEHNLSNALAATALAIGSGVPISAIVQGVASLTEIPGRMQRIRGKYLQGIVDFAHNPDGLFKLLVAARRLVPGRVILVVGCEGEKDKGKRELMGRVAGRLADKTILTSDNWFNENPWAILAMLAAGYQAVRGNDGLSVILERGQAIGEAVNQLQVGDLVVVAGRGPDHRLVLGEKEYHFDDAAYLQQCLLEREGLY